MRQAKPNRQEMAEEIAALRRQVAELEAGREEGRQAELALRQSEERYRRLLESVTDYVYTVTVVNRQPVSTVHGPNCLAVTGYAAEDYRDNPLLWLSMVPDEDRPAVLEQARRLLSDGVAAPIEHRIVHKDGSIRYVRNTPVVRRDASGAVTAYDGIINDITGRKQAEAEITRLSLHDGLTGLPNRVLFMDRLRQAVIRAERRSEKVAVFFIDLDHFKNVNDAHGHEVGDTVLAAVARRLVGCVRHSDTVARFGGDEFVALTPGLGTLDDAAGIAAKFVTAMRVPLELGGNRFQLGASVGVAVYPDHADRGDDLPGLADAAMYRVKKAGRNAWALAEALAPHSRASE